MKLRDYQQDAKQSFFKYYDEGNTGNPLIVIAAGGGKSLVIGQLIKDIIMPYPAQRIIMATHVSDLVINNYEKIIKQWPDAPAGIYSAGLNKKQPWAQIVCGSVQSMYKKVAALSHRDILIIDEAHLLSDKDSGMYRMFINELKKINPFLKVVGFTATEWRTKGGHLLDQKNAIFTDVIYNIGLGELTRRGYLTPLISKSSLIQADLSKCKITAGEFNAKEAELIMDNTELTKAALDEVEILAKDRKHFLFFCQGVDHAYHVRDELRLRGWDADVVTGETPQEHRTAMLNKFRTSKTRYALVNNAVLTTGTDLPNVDCVVWLRGTKASLLYIQINGRGTRVIYAAGYDLETQQGRLEAIANGFKPNCLVLDYAGNIERFGAVDLIHPPARKKNKNDKDEKPKITPQKICPSCREPIAISIRECKCGYIFEVQAKASHEQAASSMAIMSHELTIEKFDIAKVMYKIHTGASGIPTLRVQYYDFFGLIASEYICFSHVGYPRDKAIKWALDRGILFSEIPKTTENAYEMMDKFKDPTAIYAKKSGKYINIEGYEFEESNYQIISEKTKLPPLIQTN